ncbi:MAG: 2-oxoacid:acceptor oxidoreductase family protein [Deltaproteobacteria bacterium]|nr:2-oxoacid:acceptor oxidoreductase family protein [Deltaproteobacteria bacterium]
MYEVIWHGRGGQGVVVASQILAESAYLQGFKGVTSAPTFGPERRGAPVTASTRISTLPVRTFAQINHADCAVVLDPTLLKSVDIRDTVQKEGLIIINAPVLSDHFKAMHRCERIAVVDAVRIALIHHLTHEGAPIVNTPLLGAFARATGLVSLECLEMGLRGKLSKAVASANIAALRAAYDDTDLMLEEDLKEDDRQ